MSSQVIGASGCVRSHVFSFGYMGIIIGTHFLISEDKNSEKDSEMQYLAGKWLNIAADFNVWCYLFWKVLSLVITREYSALLMLCRTKSQSE